MRKHDKMPATTRRVPTQAVMQPLALRDCQVAYPHLDGRLLVPQGPRLLLLQVTRLLLPPRLRLPVPQGIRLRLLKGARLVLPKGLRLLNPAQSHPGPAARLSPLPPNRPLLKAQAATPRIPQHAAAAVANPKGPQHAVAADLTARTGGSARQVL